MTDRRLVGFIVDEFEGRFVDHPADRGGPTNFGVTQALYEAVMGRPASRDEIRAMSRSLAMDILHSEFVHKPQFFRIADPLVRLCTVDHAVHSGPRHAVRALQYAVLPRPPYDGVFGPVTATAANRADPAQVRRDMLAYRLRAWARLVANDQRQREFVGGWMNRVARLLEIECFDEVAQAA